MMKSEARTHLRDAWKKRIVKWQNSGLSQTEWCRQNSLKSSQLTYWKKRLQADAEPKLQPLMVLPAQPTTLATIILPSNIRVEVPCLQVPDVIKALQAAL